MATTGNKLDAPYDYRFIEKSYHVDTPFPKLKILTEILTDHLIHFKNRQEDRQNHKSHGSTHTDNHDRLNKRRHA